MSTRDDSTIVRKQISTKRNRFICHRCNSPLSCCRIRGIPLADRTNNHASQGRCCFFSDRVCIYWRYRLGEMMMTIGFFLFSEQKGYDPSRLIFSAERVPEVQTVPPKPNATVSVPTQAIQEVKPTVPLAPRNKPVSMSSQPKVPHFFDGPLCNSMTL